MWNRVLVVAAGGLLLGVAYSVMQCERRTGGGAKEADRLAMAIDQQDMETIEEIARGGTDRPELVVSDATPLGQAAQLGRLQVARYLLDHGANPNWAGAKGWEPLHFAALEKDPRMVDLLIARGADVKRLTDHRETALMVAARCSNGAVVERLLAAGSGVELRNNVGDTALLIAVKNENASSARALVRWHANVLARDAAGHTPVQIAREKEEWEISGYLEKEMMAAK